MTDRATRLDTGRCFNFQQAREGVGRGAGRVTLGRRIVRDMEVMGRNGLPGRCLPSFHECLEACPGLREPMDHSALAWQVTAKPVVEPVFRAGCLGTDPIHQEGTDPVLGGHSRLGRSKRFSANWT